MGSLQAQSYCLLLVAGTTQGAGHEGLVLVGFHHERTPELVLILGFEVDQTTISRWQSVVHHDLHPLAEPEESEAEDATVTRTKALSRGNNFIESLVVVGQVGEGGEEPTVADLSLVDVKPVPLSHEHLGSLWSRDLSWSHPSDLVLSDLSPPEVGDDLEVSPRVVGQQAVVTGKPLILE